MMIEENWNLSDDQESPGSVSTIKFRNKRDFKNKASRIYKNRSAYIFFDLKINFRSPEIIREHNKPNFRNNYNANIYQRDRANTYDPVLNQFHNRNSRK